MTLMCIDRSQSPTHKGSCFLQGRKSPVNNNLNQQNANNNSSNHNHHRKGSCSPPLSKSQPPQDVLTKSSQDSPRKLERSASDPDRRSSSIQSNSSRYKTELCRPFEESGTCKYGDKCQFAHGAKELRSMARHPKYKTELCRTFHSTGLCPYGPRCHFIHNSEQSKKSLMTNLTSTTTPLSRQKALSSLGSAGDISPVSSHGGTPTGMKSFDDLYLQAPLSPLSISQTLVNINHPNFDFVPVDCFSDASAFSFDGSLSSGGDSSVDNYPYIGNFISEFPNLNQVHHHDESVYLRLPIFNGMQNK